MKCRKYYYAILFFLVFSAVLVSGCVQQAGSNQTTIQTKISNVEAESVALKYLKHRYPEIGFEVKQSFVSVIENYIIVRLISTTGPYSNEVTKYVEILVDNLGNVITSEETNCGYQGNCWGYPGQNASRPIWG